MEKILIRTASVNDAAALLKIYSYYVENTAITFEWAVPTVEEFCGRIKHTLEKFPYIVAYRESDGELLGYAYTSPFKERAAYDWSVESSIYVKKDCHKMGIGRMLLEELERLSASQNILNINACIACTDKEDEYLTNASVHFHKKMGYSLVGKFHDSGFKFGRWYDMVWMEKMLGKHTSNPQEVISFKSMIK
jgi:phosphinothricin acetyltransferase